MLANVNRLTKTDIPGLRTKKIEKTKKIYDSVLF